MNKTNAKLLYYYFNKIYKFSLNKKIKQKYQHKQCNHKFILVDSEGLPKTTYHKYPLNVVRNHTNITHINITIVINVIIKSLIT